MLSKLNECLSNGSIVDASSFFVAHGMDVEDTLLDESDVVSHLMNGYCANHSTPACAEVSRRVKSPVKMAVAITGVVINGYSQGQLSSERLRSICSAIGIHPDRNKLESANLVKKLKLRCKDLRPLLSCTGLGGIFGMVEGLGKRSLRQLATQHQLKLHEASDLDDIRTQLVDHISSGTCQASTSGSGLCASFRDDYDNTASNDLETHVLQFASKKGNIGKKTLKRILRCRHIEFSDGDSVGYLQKLLRSYTAQLRKGKRSEWSRNLRSEEQREHDEKLEEVRQNWPQPANMEFKEECIKNFRAATCSESLQQFTCACCAESANVSDKKVLPIRDINLNLMRNRTDRVFDTSRCVPPDPPFASGPLADLLVDPDGVIFTDGGLSFQLCCRCASSLSRNKLPRLAIANFNVLGSVPPTMKVMTMVEEMLVA